MDNKSAAGPPVYLVGDSDADQYSEALIAATAAIDSPLTIRTGSGCQFVEGIVYYKGKEYPGCTGYVSSTVDWLVHQRPGVVVVSSAWDLIAAKHDEVIQVSEAGSELATISGQKISALLPDLTDVINTLKQHGDQVVSVLPNPRFGQWSADACPNVVAVADTDGCGATRLESVVDAELSAVDQMLVAAAQATDSTVLDFRSRFCPQGVCRTNTGNTWMFIDGYHITVGARESLAPFFVNALTTHATKP